MRKLQHPHAILTCSRCQKKRVVLHYIVYLPDGGTQVNSGNDQGCRWCAAMEECNVAGDLPMEYPEGNRKQVKSLRKAARR